ncbi:MAG TPA: hypothetical protein VFA15_05535 [Nitrososphaera sp.]|nr:hypothetical protein [Nitrososphaera sp.]
MKSRNIVLGVIIVIALFTIGHFFLYQSNTSPAPHDNTLIVTQNDNNKTFTLNKGERFLLKLGQLNWDISISDPRVISRVRNIAVIVGAQGIYTADNSGVTTISAQGRPICNPGEMCPQYIINWSATINVK